ncbi:MAG: carbohydrate ABC transporter permease [Anaerolineae bacterium]
MPETHSLVVGISRPNVGARGRRTSQRKHEEVAFYLAISPWLLGFICLTVGPIIASLVMSFTRYDILRPPQFIGLGNFREMFTTDPLVLLSLRVTLAYTMGAVPLGMALALVMAVLLNQKIPAVALFRTAFYSPSIITGVPVALLWVSLLRPNGVVNSFLALFGIHGPSWLHNETWVLPALVLMSLWSIGGAVVIYLAALQGVPEALYEAAELDGAGLFYKFWRITVPMISPVVFFNLVMSLIGSFQTFTSSYVMTSGGPNNASLFYALHLFRNAFRYSRMGYASALAWLLFVVILAVTALVLRSSPAWVYYEGLAR